MTPDEPLQLGLEGTPRRLFACTPSRLQTWRDCPRRCRRVVLHHLPTGLAAVGPPRRPWDGLPDEPA